MTTTFSFWHLPFYNGIQLQGLWCPVLWRLSGEEAAEILRPNIERPGRWFFMWSSFAWC